jgi:hypothetical protein
MKVSITMLKKVVLIVKKRFVASPTCAKDSTGKLADMLKASQPSDAKSYHRSHLIFFKKKILQIVSISGVYICWAKWAKRNEYDL